MNVKRGRSIIGASMVLLAAGCATQPLITWQPRGISERVATPSATERLLAAHQARDFASVRSIAAEMIALAREQEGPGSLAEAKGLFILGSAAFQQHDLAGAEQAAEHALKICTEHAESGRLPANEGPLCMGAAELRADSLLGQGRFEESSEVRRLLLPVYEDMQGQDRWRLLDRLVDLATAVLLAGHPEEANTYLGRAVSEWHQLRDGSAPVSPELLQFFGSSLIRFGDIAEAHDVLERAVQADEASGTPNGAEVLAGFAKIASLQEHAPKEDQAAPLVG